MSAPSYAMLMAGSGVPTFPCRADKKPATPHGFKDATADAGKLHALWRCHPGPLIGMPTGPASGMDLLDIDPRHGGLNWFDEFAPYTGETRVVQTRSGGTHLFYKHKPGVRNSEGVIAPGVDVRGDGGYAVLWAASGGFVVRDLPVIDWPEWLGEAAFLATKANRPAIIPTAAPFAPTEIRMKVRDRERRRSPVKIAMEMVAEAIVRVERAADGQRHYQLRQASRTIGGLLEQTGISSETAAQRLYEAAQRAGAEDLENASKTILSGLELGKGEPLVVAGGRR